MPSFQKNTNFQLKKMRKLFANGRSKYSSEPNVVRKDLPENQEQVEKIEATFPLKTYTYDEEDEDLY